MDNEWAQEDDNKPDSAAQDRRMTIAAVITRISSLRKESSKLFLRCRVKSAKLSRDKQVNACAVEFDQLIENGIDGELGGMIASRKNWC